MYNQSYEGEVVLEFKDYNNFKLAKEDNLPLGLKIKRDYEYNRPSVYLDTEDFDLLKQNASLLIRPTNEKKVGAIIKYAHSSIVKEKLLVRSEQSDLVELRSIKESEFIKYHFHLLNIDLSKALMTKLIITQNRYHKSTINLENKIHFSFDKVKYFNSNNQYINTSYIMEIEVTDKELTELSNSRIGELASYYTKKYGAEKLKLSSKYSKGLNLLKEYQQI